ncbi:hypothetical protein PAA8504_02511 [Palleronia abyssalis]|uniref:PAS domain-containing protein n=2 Tax=Palleronia abyssalis TaxID=1501240 RepID=A0A2R8BWY7_9RHOB|nr:hypothetical protein PAA8504_02511 [Palleronia abyssalis]
MTTERTEQIKTDVELQLGNSMTSRGTRYWSNGAIPLIGPDVLGEIIAACSDISVVVSDMGDILSVMVNPNHESHGVLIDWEGQDMRSFLASESIPKFDRKMSEILSGAATSRPVELNHTAKTGLTFPLSYSFHTIGPDGAILMMGRDLRPIAQMQQQLVDAQIALERDYEKQRETSTRLKVLLETTRDAVVFVSAASGRIVDLNGRAARLLRGTLDEINGTLLSRWIASPEGELDLRALVGVAQGDDTTPLTLVLPSTRSEVQLRPTLFRAAGERLILCRFDRGSEPTLTSETDSRARRLFENTPDGVVFVDRAGAVLAANDAFLALSDLGDTAAARSKSLADLLVRGGVDAKVILDNAVRNGQMRNYATRLVTPFGAEIPVEISAVYLEDPSKPAIGLAIRDTSRADGVRTGTVESNVRPSRDLVGSATLKEIVAETTEVIEKICIETAIELTDNNRVAAADMLGLSRQSLYVKLRKYGLLTRED